MHRTLKIARAAIAFAALAAGPAAANTCMAGKLMCPTKMPPGGYCECTAHGETQGGTAVTKAPPHHAANATAGGCNINPAAPGCR